MAKQQSTVLASRRCWGQLKSSELDGDVKDGGLAELGPAAALAEPIIACLYGAAHVRVPRSAVEHMLGRQRILGSISISIFKWQVMGKRVTDQVTKVIWRPTLVMVMDQAWAPYKAS